MCHPEITGVSAIYCKRSVPLGTHRRTGWYTHSNTGSYGPDASPDAGFMVSAGAAG
jgi:hypothetical protein